MFWSKYREKEDRIKEVKKKRSKGEKFLKLSPVQLIIKFHKKPFKTDIFH
jgi:hypothetical protein